MSDKTLKPYKTPIGGMFNLRAGAIHSRNEVLIVAGLARLDAEHTAHTVVLRWSGALPWHGLAFNWSSGSCAAIEGVQAPFGFLGIDGEFGLVHGTEVSESYIAEQSLSAVAAVGRHIYAVGVRGKILRSDDGRSWERLAYADIVNNKLLEAIAAYSPDEIYAVGDEGTIVLLRPTSAERIASPTNVVLAAICRGPDDLLYACGQHGVILRGRGNAWAIVEQNITTEDFWDICSFQNRVFIASNRFLYELKNNTLETVRFEDDTPLTFCRLASSSDGNLLSVGQGDAFLFDGHEWTRLI